MPAEPLVTDAVYQYDPEPDTWFQEEPADRAFIYLDEGGEPTTLLLRSIGRIREDEHRRWKFPLERPLILEPGSSCFVVWQTGDMISGERAFGPKPV